MPQPPPTDAQFTLLIIEGGLAAVAVALSFAAPLWIAAQCGSLELMLGRLARHKGLTVALVGAAMLLTRLALLPWFPAPHPFSTDDFSFLLAADTFAHGRLTNPTPAMWTHLETIHLTMMPTYMSQYFPGPGLMMAAGMLLFGHPWAGILVMSAVMCAGVCWMLQGWLPPGWALLGSVVLIARVGLFSYWSNTYTGGAPLTVLGGALVLGALPRLVRRARFGDGMLLGVGVCLLAITRPYEGVLVSLPVVLILGYRLLIAPDRPVDAAVVLRRAVAPALLVLAVLGWMGYYNYRAFGKPTVLPYTVARSTYAVVPYYIWQQARPAPHYRHVEMERFYTGSETVGFNELHSKSGFAGRYAGKLITTLLFFCGFLFLVPLVMMRRVLYDRRMLYLTWCVPVWVGGMAIGVFLIPHYLAPFTAGVYVLGLQALRHLRVWKFEGKPVGRAMTGMIVVVMCLMVGVRALAGPLGMTPPQWPIGPWLASWTGPGPFGAPRARVAHRLDSMPGKHLVIVRYSPTHEPQDEWVYNLSDVDGQKTVWARDMDDADNGQLMGYYSDRDVWVVEPDVDGGRLTPYGMTSSTR